MERITCPGSFSARMWMQNLTYWPSHYLPFFLRWLLMLGHSSTQPTGPLSTVLYFRGLQGIWKSADTQAFLSQASERGLQTMAHGPNPAYCLCRYRT